MADDITPTPDAAAGERSHQMMLAQIDGAFGSDPVSRQRAETARAEYQARRAEIMQVHGYQPPAPPTAEDIAADAHDARWARAREITESSGTNDLVQAEVERIEALPADEQRRMAASLRNELGAAVYDQLVAEAKLAVPAGETYHEAIGCNRATLQWAAVIGRASRAADRDWSAAQARLGAR